MSKTIIKRLDDIAKIERGRFSPRPRNDPRYYGGDIPFVQTGDVSRAGIYIQEYSQTLNEEGLAVSKLFPKNTILMTIAANVGDVAILGFDSACPDSLVAFTPKEGVSNKWLFHVLSTMKNKFDSLSTQNAQKNLSLEKIKPVKVQVPPPEAQEDMASTFDAWDTAIEKTEALIDAKERQFGWLIHHMVGKNQTSDQWKEYAVGDLFVVSTYASKSSSICDDGKNFIVDMGSVSRQGLLITHKRTNLNIDMLQKGDLVMPKDDIGGGNIIGKVAVIDSDEKYVCGDHVYRLKAKHDINTCFAKYVINSVPINKRLRAKANGTSQLGLRKKDVMKQIIRLPELSVQQNIANTLNTAKEEITLLKKLADQYRTQKRGLMQKLLSGEWHIKNKEAA